jgi:acyl-CoA reductase-like NAD-dependent aldehyde dehydrogenase
MKISKVDHIVDVRGEWRESEDGSHVALPLDASAVPDAVVEKVAEALWRAQSGGYKQSWHRRSPERRQQFAATARAAIAALAKALGEEG